MMSSDISLSSTSEAGWERRARRVPWGIEIEIWQLVETQTFPDSAGNLTLRSLFAPGAAGASHRSARSSGHDAVTLSKLELELVGEGE